MEISKSFPRFLLGVGPANFKFAYTIAKPSIINLTPFWNLSLFSSSSFFLTLLTESGILSAALFVSIFFKAIKQFGNSAI